MRPKRTEERSLRPSRWVSRPPGVADAEARFTALMRAAEPPSELGAASRARIWARLRNPSRARRRLANLRWAVVLVVLLMSGAVIAAVSVRRWWPAPPAPGVAAARPAERRPERATHHRAAPVGDPPREEGLPTPAPEVVPSGAANETAPPASASDRRATRAARRIETNLSAPPPHGPAASGPSALAGETPLLTEALTRLRQKRDPRGALETLDLYRARYPEGTLKREAEGARIDALLSLGRNAEALTELRGLSLQPQGRDQELRLIRGELTAATDCPRAIPDFDRVLSEQASAALAERALHDRAACRARLGDKAAAARDLTEYLRRYPSGRFAPEARRAVEGGRGDL